MAISYKARYCNGFPVFVSNVGALERSFGSMSSHSFLSFPTFSGHKSGHIFSGLSQDGAKLWEGLHGYYCCEVTDLYIGHDGDLTPLGKSLLEKVGV
jgi:hypothetical protein